MKKALHPLERLFSGLVQTVTGLGKPGAGVSHPSKSGSKSIYDFIRSPYTEREFASKWPDSKCENKTLRWVSRPSGILTLTNLALPRGST